MLSAERMPPEAQQSLLEQLLSTTGSPVDVSERERALSAYADRLTREPAAITAADIERLRAAGLDDLAIHDACAIVAYYAFVNRIADGLGVDLESRS